MKSLTWVLLTVLVGSRSTAQNIYSYSDSLHSYEITIDSSLSNDDVNYDCSIKIISVYAKENHKLIQTINVPENYFSCDIPPNKIFLINDINFDGLPDFMVRQFLPAAPNIPYYWWYFNSSTQQFERDTALEEITSPEFDTEQKLIISSWRAGYGDYGSSKYKYIDGRITLIEEFEDVIDSEEYPGKTVLTHKKLINGELKLVETTIEDAEDNK